MPCQALGMCSSAYYMLTPQDWHGANLNIEVKAWDSRTMSTRSKIWIFTFDVITHCLLLMYKIQKIKSLFKLSIRNNFEQWTWNNLFAINIKCYEPFNWWELCISIKKVSLYISLPGMEWYSPYPMKIYCFGPWFGTEENGIPAKKIKGKRMMVWIVWQKFEDEFGNLWNKVYCQ